MPGPLLLYLVPNDAYFYSHRLPMARAAQDAGFSVGLVTGSSTRHSEIEAQGVRIIACRIAPGGAGFPAWLRATWDLFWIYRRERPAVVHHITLKAIVCGAPAAAFAMVPRVVNAFAGLGHIFTTQDLRARVLRTGIRLVLPFFLRRTGSVTLVQNADDGARLARLGLADPDRTVLIPGSGVDPDRFPVLSLPSTDAGLVCVFAGRMIGIKGLETLRMAFEMLRARAPTLSLWLCGAPDPNNPGSWSAESLRAWEAASPNVVWKGQQNDMTDLWAHAHFAVQPSLGGEGVPKSLLEAAACGRGIVASDTAGCRDVVEHGANGLLVPPGNARALADALAAIVRDPGQLEAWGQRSRALIFERDFSAQAVTDRTRRLYESLFST